MMDYYFLTITIIDIFVLGIMCILTQYNETLNERQRHWYILSFVLIIFISTLELITVIIDNGPKSLRWINILANYLGFGLTPAVPIFLASSLEKNKSMKYAIALEIAFLLFLAISFPFKTIFYVNHNNQYMREDYFWIYVVIYFIGILYLLVITFQVATRYQNKSKICVFPITIFLLASTLIQVIFPHVHVSWLCVSLLSILYYSYCNAMWQQLDGLTGLLNQRSYLNLTSSFSKNGTLIVFDIDNFKDINDNYGHLVGDQCLEEIADCIKKAYSQYGYCYRIGGDEFCVLLNDNVNAEDCYINLIEQMQIKRNKLNILPDISVGSAPFVIGDDIITIKATADNNMYLFKKKQKSLKKKNIY